MYTLSEYQTIKTSEDTFKSRKFNNNSNNNHQRSNNNYQRNGSVRFQRRNNRTSNGQENNNIDKEESDKKDNNIQDIYDDAITTLNEDMSSSILEVSTDVHVALV